MTGPPPDAERLAEIALEHRGGLPLAVLVEEAVPVARLRQLARRFGLSPKGFRIDRAPARVLAAELVRDLVPDVVAAVCVELRAALAPPPATAPAAAPAAARPEDSQVERHRRELERQQKEVDRARQAANRLRQRLTVADRELAQERARSAALRVELEAALSAAARPGTAAERDVVTRLHDIERDREAWEVAELQYRRRLAELNTQLQEAVARAEEAEARVPKHRRRKEKPSPPPPPERFRIPYFTSEFYKSIESMDRRSVEAAVEAVLRFATSGHGYPGLEVKQLEGHDFWSMRAGIKVRVYFRPRPDGDIDVLACGDREDQNTLLRRWR